MQKEFSLSDFFKVLKKSWWKMLLLALPVMIITGMLTHVLVPKRYSSTSHFLIQNVSMNADYTNVSLLSAADYLANDYISIIKGDEVMGLISQELEKQGIQYTPSQLRGMISTAKASQSSEFSVSVSNTNPNHAYAIAELIYKKAPALITKIAKPYSEYYDDEMGALVEGYDKEGNRVTVWVKSLSCVAQLRAPVRDTVADSPNPVRNAIVGGLIAALIVYVICFLRKLFDTVIHTEEELKNCVDLPILGMVPTWNTTTGSRYEKGDK